MNERHGWYFTAPWNPVWVRRADALGFGGIMRQRIAAFGLLLGGVPALDDDLGNNDEFSGKVLAHARKPLESLNKKLRA
jgi:hypothetical protein